MNVLGILFSLRISSGTCASWQVCAFCPTVVSLNDNAQIRNVHGMFTSIDLYRFIIYWEILSVPNFCVLFGVKMLIMFTIRPKFRGNSTAKNSVVICPYCGGVGDCGDAILRHRNLSTSVRHLWKGWTPRVCFDGVRMLHHCGGVSIWLMAFKHIVHPLLTFSHFFILYTINFFLRKWKCIVVPVYVYWKCTVCYYKKDKKYLKKYLSKSL